MKMTDETKAPEQAEITSENSPAGILGMVEDKFIVIKKADLEFLPHYMRIDLSIILDEIEKKRSEQGRNPNNYYLVVNVDEPYAEEVLLVMRKNGHCKPEYSLQGLSDDKFDCLDGLECVANCWECPLSRPNPLAGGR
jgi:hypothetical protein